MTVAEPQLREVETVDLHPLTVEQYHQMLEAGILEDGEPIELLDGLLVRKDRGSGGSVRPRHVYAIARLAEIHAALVGYPCHVLTQAPITIPLHNEPEPDAMIVTGSPDDYLDRHPGATEVSAVIEVADTSLRRDRTLKLRTYAAAGIPQYLIVNLLDGQIECHEGPQGETYSRRTVLKAGETIGLRLPGQTSPLSVAASDWLG